MDLVAASKRLIEVYENADVVRSGIHYTTINELVDQVPATRPDTIEAAVTAILSLGPITATKIITEEDKGALLIGLAATKLALPLAMARWYSYPIKSPHSIVVSCDMEYAKGQLLVNGVQKGDKLILLDDTLSTGGTAVGLITAADQIGAEVVEMRVVVEKLNYGGRRKLRETFGIKVKAFMGIIVDNSLSPKVKEIWGHPYKGEVEPCLKSVESVL